MADTLSLVCRVERPCGRFARTKGDFGGFGVANFADHDDVRVLPQDGAQTGGEGPAGFRVDLHLVDALEHVFDGVFDGDDVLRCAAHLIERGIKSGGLAGTGRSGDQQHALRLQKDSAQRIRGSFGESQGGETTLADAGSRSRMTDFLAVLRGSVETLKSILFAPI